MKDQNSVENMSPVKMGAISIGSVALFLACVGLVQKGHPALAVCVIGACILMTGVIVTVSTLRNKTFRGVILIVPIGGLLMLLGGILYQCNAGLFDLSDGGWMQDHLADVLLGAALILGLLVFVLLWGSAVKKQKVCTYRVTAECVSVDKWVTEDTTMYCPVYEIYYRGETIKLRDHMYTNLEKYKVGEHKELLINPDNPQEFYNEETVKKTKRYAALIGVFFISIALIGLIVVHFI